MRRILLFALLALACGGRELPPLAACVASEQGSHDLAAYGLTLVVTSAEAWTQAPDLPARVARTLDVMALCFDQDPLQLARGWTLTISDSPNVTCDGAPNPLGQAFAGCLRSDRTIEVSALPASG